MYWIADLFLSLGEYWKSFNERSCYILDSSPMAACDNYRIQCCKLFQGESWRGYIASKKCFYYSVRVYIVITENGQMVEFFLAPGAINDTTAWSNDYCDFPPGYWLTINKAYHNYTIEDVVRKAGVERLPIRKNSLHHPVPPFFTILQGPIRKIIETTGGLAEQLLPESIRAVTARRLKPKVALSVLADSTSFFW